MAFNSIVIKTVFDDSSHYFKYGRLLVCHTYSMVNKQTFFCTDCSAEAHIYGGRCDDCFERWVVYLRKKNNPYAKEPHCCSGEFDYDRGYYVCDEADDPNCSQYKKPTVRSCVDCGHVPKDGHFLCFRGDDPLCADCEKTAYGPDETEDCCEGRCSKCDLFYDIYSSSDRRDICYNCCAASQQYMDDYLAWEAGEIDDYGQPILDEE